MDEQKLFRKFRSVRAELMLENQMFGAVVMQLRPQLELTDEEFVASVSGDGKLSLGKRFFEFTKEEQKGILAHEVLHVALSHLDRMGKSNMELWNIAADLVVNDLLLSSNFQLPKEGLFDRDLSRSPEGKLLSVEKVYKTLTDKVKQFQQGQGNSNQQQNSDGSSGDGFDQMSQKRFDKHIPGKGESSSFSETIKRIVSGFSSMPGTMPGEMQEYLKESLAPKLDWRELLRRYLQKVTEDNVNWRKRKEFLRNFGYFPTLETEDKVNVIFCIDVSGSISPEDLQKFYSEILGVIRAVQLSKVTVVQFDTEITNVEEISSSSSLQEIKIVGRGGTDFACLENISDKISKKADVVILMSDFYANSLDTYIADEMIYLVVDNDDFDSGVYKTIHLD